MTNIAENLALISCYDRSEIQKFGLSYTTAVKNKSCSKHEKRANFSTDVPENTSNSSVAVRKSMAEQFRGSVMVFPYLYL